VFRPRFCDSGAGTETIAKFVGNFLSGQLEQIGPQ
jgi:hypothetical protein